MANAPSTLVMNVDAASLAELIDACVDAKLASLGGEMLAIHGPGAAHENAELASVGGYLLQAFGNRVEDVPDELRDPPAT